MMRVLSVRQPWAGAILYSVTDPRDGTVIAAKDVENRPQNLATVYQGPVAIHASQTFDESAFKVSPKSALGRWWDWCEFDATQGDGMILGVVDLIGAHHSRDCVTGLIPAACSAWAEPDRWHHELRNPRPLEVEDRMPFKGSLGLRTLPADVETELLRRLA